MMTDPRGKPVRCRHRTVATCVALTFEFLTWASLGAQELPLQREYPGSGRAPCPAQVTPRAPSTEARAQALELTSGSDQALILGDLSQAATLLDRAAELDPTSAELAYRRARLLEQRSELAGAVAEYCRALSLSPGGPIGDADHRLAALLEEQQAVLPAEAITAFRSALAAADRGAMSDALASFELAARQAPGWAAAHYNRGVVLIRLGHGNEAATALLSYLELRPDAPDAIAVSRRVGQLQSLVATGGPSPGMAAALGTLVPGMGQFYAGRALGGLVVLSLAGGALAAGFLVTEVNVRCLSSVPAGEKCPTAEVVSREVSQPHLTLALGTAAAAGLIGALEAFLNARGRRAQARAGVFPSGPRGPTVEAPTVTLGARRVDLSLIGLRFR